jgi:hypothetical protein
MPKQEVQERYLPLKAGRLTSADTTPQEEPSHVSDFQEVAYVGRTSRGPALRTRAHVAHVHAWMKLGTRLNDASILQSDR